jgi:hypothetical protein
MIRQKEGRASVVSLTHTQSPTWGASPIFFLQTHIPVRQKWVFLSRAGKIGLPKQQNLNVNPCICLSKVLFLSLSSLPLVTNVLLSQQMNFCWFLRLVWEWNNDDISNTIDCLPSYIESEINKDSVPYSGSMMQRCMEEMSMKSYHSKWLSN